MTTLKERFEKLPRDLHCKNALNEAYVLQFVRQELLALADEVSGVRKDRCGSGETEHWWLKYDEVVALIRSKSNELV